MLQANCCSEICGKRVFPHFCVYFHVHFMIGHRVKNTLSSIQTICLRVTIVDLFLNPSTWTLHLYKIKFQDLKLEKGGVKVICVGSVWKSWQYLKSGFIDEIHRSGVVDELTLLRLTTSAAVGACYIAADKLNCKSMNKTFQTNTEKFYHYKRDNMPPASTTGYVSYKLTATCDNGVATMPTATAGYKNNVEQSIEIR